MPKYIYKVGISEKMMMMVIMMAMIMMTLLLLLLLPREEYAYLTSVQPLSGCSGLKAPTLLRTSN